MPLQNRVDPFGRLHTNNSRGDFMGNRGGRFHDPVTKTLKGRPWASIHWIICVCQFKGRQRQVWGIQADGRPSYTELFFLDEVTALAAGHRPCFECRRAAALRYAAAFSRATGSAKPKVTEIDSALHRERLTAAPRELQEGEIATLPNGAMIANNGKAYALGAGGYMPWSFKGYGSPVATASLRPGSILITPPTTIEILRQGYEPVWHGSAQANVD